MKSFLKILSLLSLYMYVSLELINLHKFGEEDSRNPGILLAAVDKYGFLMCARNCEQTEKCTSFNFNPSSLSCELIQEEELVSGKIASWLHFGDILWLQVGNFHYRCTSNGKTDYCIFV